MTDFPRWFKSSYSEHGGACVEVATNPDASDGLVPVRDSKDLAGPVLGFRAGAFATFVGAVKGGAFGRG
ncbi:DUF397 domain-containing protein [Streptomyces albidoflavus]